MYPFIAFALVILVTGIAFVAVTSTRSDNRPFESLQPHVVANFETHPQNPFSNFHETQTRHQRPERYRSQDSSGVMIVVLLAMLGALAFVARYDQDAKPIVCIDDAIPEQPAFGPKAVQPVEDFNNQTYRKNPLLISNETPSVSFDEGANDKQTQSKGVPLYQVYWVVWLNAYPTLKDAMRIQRAFLGRPIRLAILPDGRYLAFIHYDNPGDNILCAEDINKYLADLRPFGIYTPRMVKNIGPVE